MANALDEVERQQLLARVARQREAFSSNDEFVHVVAYQDAVARLLPTTTELDVAVISGEVEAGQLVTLTQDFNVRRLSDERGAFRATLDIDRAVSLEGSFSTDWLIGSTGHSETFGRRRFTMLAYLEEADLLGSHAITLRPVFIGWRLEGPDQFAALDDRHEVWPSQCDQFALAKSKRPTDAQRTTIASLSEDAVIGAFAAITGEPYVPRHWGGETSDLYTSRLTIEETPVDAAFAFKGPSVRGRGCPARRGFSAAVPV